MKQNTRPCKRCDLQWEVDEDSIQAMIDEDQLGISIVTQEVYETRLDICLQCPSFIFGTTCMHNGKLIRYIAKFSESKCPYPFGGKWDVG